jgi:hypothetical protein
MDKNSLSSINSAGSFLENMDSTGKESLQQPEQFIPANEIEDFTHNFHKPCLFEWMKLNTDCPVCRTRVTDENMDWNLQLNARMKAGYPQHLLVSSAKSYNELLAQEPVEFKVTSLEN